jgi:hypothetical protein
VDRNDQDKDSQGPLVSDLPDVDELSGTSKDIEGGGSEGESKEVDGEVENIRENENDKVENGEAVTSEVEVAAEEKEEKKVQSLSE